MHNLLLFLSVFIATIVEGVEALTIVLAVGTTRGWRSTWYGVLAALITLTAFIAILGPALTIIPINALRLIVGGLLLIFGLQWLRKAILRASGFTSLHDEAAIYKKATEEARKVKTDGHKGLIDDWYSFTVAFKGVLLEGLEVAFIVITFGANQKSIPLAIVSAFIAVIVIVILGLKIHKPLSRVPENTLKFIVGIMLTSFGIFWGSEGAGVYWPGKDAALIGIIFFIVVTSFIQVAWLTTKHSKLKVKMS
jgi:uncharacterized membrane protein